jgi:hexosaminidase
MLLLLLLLALRLAAADTQGSGAADPALLFPVLPLPASLTLQPGCLLVSPELALLPAGPGGGGSALLAALQRTAATLRSACARGEAALPAAALPACAAPQLLASVEVRVAAPPSGAPPAQGDDEAYSLTLAPGAASVLAAGTLWGALRGLETLTQLAACDGAPDAAAARLLIPAASLAVQDAPRFSHRGLMLDTGRAFLPLGVLMATLDAMAYSKLNVLHWHISDDESMPFASAALPDLVKGAFQAPSLSHTYSRADLQAVVAAASARGIRVVPELDVPGHTLSWFKGYPALASPCAAGGAFTVPMDPTLNSTYELLDSLFAEVSEIFPDALFHIGVRGRGWARPLFCRLPSHRPPHPPHYAG